MKVSTVCPPSSPLFLSMVEPALRAAGHEVRRFDDGDWAAADQWGDVVWAEWALRHAGELSRFGTKPLVVRILGWEVWESAFREINWPRVRCVVYACAEHYAEACRIAPAMTNVRATQTCSPLDFQRFALQPHGTWYRIGFVGQKDARKNLFAALQILTLLPPRYTLHVAGHCEDARLRAYIRHAIDSFKLGERVKFYGRVEDLATWWEPIDYCLVASTSDQGPRSLAEAMALGVMPVVHDYPGARGRVPESSLWQTVTQAAGIIRRGYVVAPQHYRAFVYEGRKNPAQIRAALLAAVENA